MKEQGAHSGYETLTIHSPNFFARTAHRFRIRKALELINPRLSLGKVLDYGCGTGVLVSNLNELKPGCAIGYEPFLKDRYKDELPIYSELSEILDHAPYHTITLFEVLEHLRTSAIEEMLQIFDEILASTGFVLVSVPIEIGPVILLKELNRYRLTRKWKYKFFEFFRALFFGIVGSREDNLDDPFLMSHKGFDFRWLMKFIESKGWQVEILCYSPLPIKCWYGNSQVFFAMRK
jgi:SAM-dependent methyltransferase